MPNILDVLRGITKLKSIKKVDPLDREIEFVVWDYDAEKCIVCTFDHADYRTDGSKIAIHLAVEEKMDS